MKQLFLASEINIVAQHISKKLKNPPNQYQAVFINTAAEPEGADSQWVKDNKKGLTDLNLNIFDYTITNKTLKEIEKDLKNVNWIHVNGGNTFYLLLQIKKSGFDQFVKKAINHGVIYTGSSAGSIIASPDIHIASCLETKIYEKELENTHGLNLVDFIIMPHWGSRSFKDLYLNHRLELAYKPENKIILLNDYQYVQIEDDHYKIIDIRKD